MTFSNVILNRHGVSVKNLRALCLSYYVPIRYYLSKASRCKILHFAEHKCSLVQDDTDKSVIISSP